MSDPYYVDYAVEAVEKIVEECGKHSLGWAWEALPAAQQAALRNTWTTIVRDAIEADFEQRESYADNPGDYGG